MCPTLALGISFSMPWIIPSPARRRGITANFLPAIVLACAFANGVSTSIFSTGRCLVISYTINPAISSTSSLNSLTLVSTFRIIPSLCCTRGWSMITTRPFELFILLKKTLSSCACIFSMRLECLPPLKGVSSQTSIICKASPIFMTLPPNTKILALLWSRLIFAM